MRKFYALLATALAACPLTSLAQIPGSAPATYGRLYVGLGTYVSNFQHIAGNSFSELSVPVQVLAGYQLRPRLALQVGIARSTTSFDYSSLNSVQEGPGSSLLFSNFYDGKSTSRRTTISVQGRYSLRPSARRFQVDVLAGYGLEREQYSKSVHYTALDNNQHVYDDTWSSDAHDYTQKIFTAGLSARYRLGQHLEAALEGSLVAQPGHWASPPGQEGSLSLRYRFGRLN